MTDLDRDGRPLGAFVPSTSEWPRWSSSAPLMMLREVAPNLWIGGVDAPWTEHPGTLGECARGQRRTLDTRWSLILDVAGWQAEHPHAHPYCRRERGPEVWSVDLDDTVPIRRRILDRLHAIYLLHCERCAEEGRDRSVLVVCLAGCSRSASVAYGLLRREYDLDHAEALRRVRPRHEGTILEDPRWPHPITLKSVKEWAEVKRG